MRGILVLLLYLCSAPLVAQEEFQPPEEAPASARPVQLGLFGFASRIGVDFEGQGQAIASFAVDVGHLFTDRLRFRPSAELGFGWGDNTYVANLEIIYRFTTDTVVVVPYLGAGVGLAGQEGCDTAADCPSIWTQFVLGFEMKMQGQFNWLLEYHSEDAFGRHRLFLGLTTRRSR